MRQRTIASSTSIQGRGLHTGTSCRITFHPAEVHHGIVFIRQDLGNGRVPALWNYVHNTDRATTLALGSMEVRTVEHVLAAIFGLGITNLDVVLDHVEVPILDGSAAEFGSLLREAGVVDQSEPRVLLPCGEQVEIVHGRRRLTVQPSSGLSFLYRLYVPGLTPQTVEYEFCEEDFFEAIGNARTFATAADLMAMKGRGLVKGLDDAPGFILTGRATPDASLEDVLGRRPLSSVRHRLPHDDVLSLEPPRHPDEAARHKILDLIGDLALSGCLLTGRFEAVETGHFDNIALLRKMMHCSARWPPSRL